MSLATDFDRSGGGAPAAAPSPVASPPDGGTAESSDGTTEPRTKKRYSGYVASLKNDACIPWRKTVERDLMHLLEVDPNVRSYVRHPERIAFRSGDKVRHHTVGFRVVTARGTAMLDILPPESPKAEEACRAAAALYARQRIAYAAIPEAEIRQEPRLGNAKGLLLHRQVEPPAEFLIALAEAVAHGARTIGDLGQVLTAWQPVRPYVCAAALRGHLRLDLSKPISDATLILP